MIHQTGVPSKDMVLSKFPKNEALVKPKAILECYEEIPCNPCSTVCPFHAISIKDQMNDMPVLDLDLCTGCAICVSHCPGLAIMVTQLLGQKAIFKIPYEMKPLPVKGEVWHGVNRNGDVICDVIIESVLSKKQTLTALVTVSADAKYLHDFITIRKHG